MLLYERRHRRVEGSMLLVLGAVVAASSLSVGLVLMFLGVTLLLMPPMRFRHS
jgi:hypothetical protein